MLYSTERLKDVHPDLVTLAYAAGEHEDAEVVFGARTFADEQTAIVTHHSHLRTPLDSKHVIYPPLRPLAEAVDLAPYPINWTDIARFTAFAGRVKEWATNLNISISWGGDWPNPFDFDHFELRK
jgi:peptidoglycan L-alanyl-D-glutamate endopeptidase CwlK